MKSLFQFLVLPLISMVHLGAAASLAADKDEVLVVPEDMEIKDSALEKKLLRAVKENGTLTSTRQLDSYILAVLCEYPPKDMKTKPYCVFRKVKVRAGK